MTKMYTGLNYTLGTTAVNTTGEFTDLAVDNGTGDSTLSYVSGRGLAPTDGAIVALPQSDQDASGLQSFGVVATDSTVQITGLEEGATGGASALTDLPLALLEANGGTGLARLEIVALAVIDGDAATPAFLFNSGAFDETFGTAGVEDVGAGNYRVQFVAGYGPGLNNTDEYIFAAQTMEQWAASGLWSAAAFHRAVNLGNEVEIELLKEGAAGAASARTDGDVMVAAFRVGSSPSRGNQRVIGYGSVDATAGTLLSRSGVVSGIADNGVGDFTVTFSRELSINDTVIFRGVREALGASENTYVGMARESLTTARFKVGQEDAAGAASIAADVNFDFIILG